jgi:hypothetical protein
MRLSTDWPSPPASTSATRDLRCGETPCSVCDSGPLSHRTLHADHEFTPWSQPEIRRALAAAEGPTIQPYDPWPITWRWRLAMPLFWLAARVAGTRCRVEEAE